MRRKSHSAPSREPLGRGWIAVGICVAVLGALLFLLRGTFPRPVESSRAPIPRPDLAPAEQERALRAEQLDAARKLVAAFPESDDAVYLLGLVHNEQGNSAAATQQWQRSLEMDASRADANDSLGYAFLLRDEYDQAERYFRQALALDPTLATANFRLANTLVHQGKLLEAVAILEKASSLSAEGHRLLGEAYQQLKQFPKAEAGYRAAIAANPQFEQAYYGLSKVLAQLGDDEKSREAWAKFSALKEENDRQARDMRANYDSLAITKRSVAQTHTDVARVYILNNQPMEAEAMWLKAAALDESNTLSRLQLAVHYQQTHQYGPALKYYQEVARIDPADALVQLNIGRVCLALKQIENAEKAFEKVVQLAPNQPEGHAALAQVRGMRKQ